MINIMKTFYLVGSILLFISGIGQIWSLSVLWGALTMGARVSMISGTIFNFMLSGLFIYVYKTTPDMQINDKQLDDILEKYK